ncbi:MAG: YraN family protein [Bacillota bacterium]|jgi:putative endonuclease
MSKKALGKIMEDRACVYLGQEGYSVICRNFYSRYGEIDIIAWDGPVLAFIEVRYRRKNSLVTPLESVTISKRRKICLAAGYYLAQNGISDCVPMRVDICSIQGSPSVFPVEKVAIHITKGAVEFP